METLNEQLKNSIEEKTGTRPTGDTVRETLDSASGQENSTLADALVDFIDDLPGGGGATTPNFCMEPPLLVEGWDGDTTGLESVELAAQGGTYTYYKVSDKVIPFYYSGASLLTYTCVDQNNEEYSPNAIVSVDGYLILAGAVISSYYDNYTSALWDNTIIAPSSGTWFRKDATRYIKNISFTIEH